MSATSDESGWSSFDPLSIPIETRRKQYDLGNVCPNPSFEDGSPGVIDSWTVVGDGVEWIDADEVSTDDVATGSRAIRISRESVDEVNDSGFGVESDYIAVIPGNYTFTYRVKLRDIHPVRERFGSRLYDAIDVRVQYFDRDRRPINGAMRHPHYKVQIDNSFKGFSFANYWHIEEFGWARVLASTFTYPFSEGDVPDECRYVKLFLGLRSRGTMWIDDVDYRFSRWNFTTLERLEPMMDTNLDITERLIPTPKQIGDAVAFELLAENDLPPMILAPDDPPAATASAVTALKERLDALLAVDTQIVTSPTSDMLDGDVVTFSVGETSLIESYRTQLPFQEISGYHQGYFVACIGDLERVVFLSGNSPIGTYYAVATALQLFDEDERSFVSVQIIDYPDFVGRSYKLGPLSQEGQGNRNVADMERMALLKLNKAYTGYGDPGKAWRTPPENYFKDIERFGRRCRESGIMDLAAQVNPYFHLDFMAKADTLSEEQRRYWLHCRPDDIDLLTERVRALCRLGASCVMLLSDDYVPHEADHRMLYALWEDDDKKRFVNLHHAHAHMINQIHDMLGHEFPECRLEFCPPWYNNSFVDRSRGWAEQYFRDLIAQIPDDVAIVWTGSTVRSLSIDAADIERFRRLIGRYPMLFDNTLYARRNEASYGGYAGLYPGKVRMCNLFEPYDISVPDSFHRFNAGGHLYQNCGGDTEFGKIQYATVADYEWNTEAYDPDKSLWKTLLCIVGDSAARDLLTFNDRYYGFIDMKMRIEREGSEEGYTEAARAHIDGARRAATSLAESLPSGAQDLLGEVLALVDSMEV